MFPCNEKQQFSTTRQDIGNEVVQQINCDFCISDRKKAAEGSRRKCQAYAGKDMRGMACSMMRGSNSRTRLSIPLTARSTADHVPAIAIIKI
jgi:hypothetical protein